MPRLDVFIRCLPSDRPHAERLEQALAEFGYMSEIGCDRRPEIFSSLEAHREVATATIVLWSIASIADNDFIWEIADLVKFDPWSGQELLYEVKVEPFAVNLMLRNTSLLPHRRQFRPTNLAAWDGSAADKALKPLLWELPRPAMPRLSPPQPIPISREDSFGSQPSRGLETRYCSHFTKKPKQWAERAELEAAVSQGNVDAMLELAEIVIYGEEREFGLLLLRRAAAAGDLRAYFDLGVFDQEAGEDWFESGVALGCIHCLESLASRQGARGRALVQSFYQRFPDAKRESWALLALARNLWERDSTDEGRRQAARMVFQAHIELGSSIADIHIGDFYLHGLGGVAKDKKEAIEWYQTAFKAENQEAHRLAMFRLLALGVKPKASREQIQDVSSDPFPDDFWDLRR